jgi:hypothetical protein
MFRAQSQTARNQSGAGASSDAVHDSSTVTTPAASLEKWRALPLQRVADSQLRLVRSTTYS